MTNKLVIRRLPPSIGEDEFLRQVSPLPEYDFFCFFEADPSLGSHAFSRAYINFINSEDMLIFKEQFDNYVFLDRNGHEYPAVVEQSLWQKSPKNGPFYVSPGFNRRGCEDKIGLLATDDPVSEEVMTGLEEDSDFLEFVQKIKEPKRRSQQSPIEALENNLEAVTSASENSAAGGKSGKAKNVPPLLGFVNQRRLAKNIKTAKNSKSAKRQGK